MQLDYIKCGDSAELLKTLPADSIDLTVTSPPYDNLRDYKGFTFDFPTIARELYRVTKPGGVLVWIVADGTVDGSETGTSFRQALQFMDLGYKLNDTMIWSKDGFSGVGNLQARYAQTFEYMFVLSKGRPGVFNPIKDRPNKYGGTAIHGTTRNADGTVKPNTSNGKVLDPYGVRYNVWEISVEHSKENRGHPAVFPEKLVRDHIRTWSNPGAVVLDPFLGSGTTAVSALKENRHYIGFEISEEYTEHARKRVEDYTAQISFL